MKQVRTKVEDKAAVQWYRIDEFSQENRGSKCVPGATCLELGSRMNGWVPGNVAMFNVVTLGHTTAVICGPSLLLPSTRHNLNSPS